MYLWSNSCATYIIAIDDVLLRMFVGSFFGLSDGVGAAVGSNVGVARSAHVARRQVPAGNTILPNRHNRQRMHTTTHNGQSSASTSSILLLSHRSSL